MSAAHSILRPGLRLRAFAAFALLAAACFLVSAGGARADAANPRTTLTLTASPTSVTAGQPVLLTATVTGVGTPTGVVDFWNNTGSGRVELNVADGDIWLTPTGPNTATATWTWYPAFGNYTVIATYTSSDPGNFSNSTSPGVAVQSASAAKHNTSLQLTASPSTIQSGQTVSFTAAVAETDGVQIPTGNVIFTASPTANPSSQSTLGNVALDASGVATLPDVGGWVAGTYTISAAYQGDAFDNPIGSTISFTVTPAPSTTVLTTTSLQAIPVIGQVNDPILLVATVTQVGNPTPPPAGDEVDFRSSSIWGTDVELGHATLQADGTATLEATTFPLPGNYTITASYLGNIFQHIQGSAGITGLTINGAAPTQTSYAGDAQASSGGTAQLAGKLLDAFGNPISGKTVQLTVGAETCSGSTSASGVATCPVTISEGPGTYSVLAKFGGDANWNPSAGTGQLQVLAPDPTSLTYQGTTSALGGAPVTLSFLLKDAATDATLANRPVTIGFDGNTYNATTDANGVASVAATAPLTTQSYPVSASFAGAAGYSASDGSGTLAVQVLATSLTYTGDLTANGGGPATIAFVLKDEHGAVLAGRSVTMTIDGHTYTASTDANGVATASILAPLSAATYPVSASFGGAPGYLASTGSGSLKVSIVPTTTTYDGDTQATVGATATLAATLVDPAGNPLAGKLVTLQFGNESCSGTTDGSGHFSCPVVVTDLPGTYTVTATFAGDPGYLGSFGTGSIVVAQAATSVVDNVTGNFLLGSSLTLSGTLTANGGPLAGKTLDLAFGGAGCSGVTDATGTATCQVPVPGPTGPATTVASFGGDASYKASSDTKPALVYAFAPGGGSFVVGDLTATGSVYFWGSQWWKQNQLSAGDKQSVDPAAFKGFAAAVNGGCGGTWSTAPGNSTPPPAGPLPAYMAVIVTSQNHKAPGKVVSGDIVHIVIVKTSPGYAGDPGHAGTGTVVATVC